MKDSQTQFRLGILTRKPEQLNIDKNGFFEDLATVGYSAHLDIFAFSPQAVNESHTTIQAYSFDTREKTWKKKTKFFPHVIYDRYLVTNALDRIKYFSALRTLFQVTDCQLLNPSLPNKWDMYTFLFQNPSLQPYLPQTIRLEDPKQLRNWLIQKKKFILKPMNSCQGKGVLQINQFNKNTEEIKIIGRNRNNNPVYKTFLSYHQLLKWMSSFIHQQNYLLQSYCTLFNREHVPFDIRALVQKNQSGLLEHLGNAIREGVSQNITANLHGGGHSLPLARYLIKLFGHRKADSLMEEINQLVLRIMGHIHNHFHRIFELGIDLGVDSRGKVWIIEINSKPGRQVFMHPQLRFIYRHSISKLIDYVIFLSKQPHWARKAAFTATSLGG